ncbi:hypothetical protein P3S67_003061 [Capsicum chacoense]
MTCIFIFSIALLLIFHLTIAQCQTGFQTYLVHVNKPYVQVVEPSRIIHAYHHVAIGFAARLSTEEVKDMKKKDGFVSARIEKILSLHTTHTPNFLGLYQNMGFWQESNYGKGVIIELLDTGINPGHPSFSDKNMPPPPAKWKGKCENITCNKKLIRARNFVKGSTSSPFEGGHGTLTSSVAAGNFVDDANLFGNANGTAAGMAPLAHIAMYKVCSDSGCSDIDTLAAIDAAIDDGVDVLSLSIGGYTAPFYDDGMAIGAFAAIQRGIFMSASAGNDDHSVLHWQMWPLGFSRLALAPMIGRYTDVKGKVVVCHKGGGITRLEKGQTVRDAGGVAMVLVNLEIDGDCTLAYVDVLPTTNVGYSTGELIKAYINSTSTPSADPFQRGPTLASPGIHKPDIIGPGVNILAATHISVENKIGTDLAFNIVSAAIKSAIMTTADQFNIEGQPILDQRNLPADIFAIGAGHINASKASDPGHIYDIQPHNYIRYLCGLGYADKQIELIVQQTTKCSLQSSILEAELNYPSFSITLGPQSQNYTRIVTNVGDASSTYVVNITQVQGVHIVVEPTTLVFTKVNQHATYSVSFTQIGGITGHFVQGAIS